MRSTLELSTAMQVPQGELQFAPLEAECMNCRLEMIVMAWLFLGGLSPAQTRTGPHDPEKDKQAVVALEDQWLHAKDPATLDRMLATEFVHVVPADHFLNKQQHIDWFTTHPPPESRHTKFGKLEVRIYGDVAIVNGSVIAADRDASA